MNPKNPELWDQLRTAYRPPAPALDTASIMDAIRRDAAVHPLRRASIGLAAPVPGWVCTADVVNGSSPRDAPTGGTGYWSSRAVKPGATNAGMNFAAMNSAAVAAAFPVSL